MQVGLLRVERIDERRAFGVDRLSRPPTSLLRLFTAEGVINIRNKKWEDDFSPIDPEGTAFVDTLYTKAYLHHLVTCGEMLAAQIASLHNIAFYLRLVGMAREHIAAGDFKPWKDAMVAKLTRRL